MTQQERNGLNEAAEISAHAAGAVRGAIKTGKMVSGAAKGAAAAGPYGAAAAALWTHRKAVAAIIAGLLVLPVLFIILLPSLIFGGLTKAGVEGSPDTPILNDNAAIVENINQISQAISDLLEEGQEGVAVTAAAAATGTSSSACIAASTAASNTTGGSDAPRGQHRFCQHRATCMAHIDAKALHEAVDFL